MLIGIKHLVKGLPGDNSRMIFYLFYKEYLSWSSLESFPFVIPKRGTSELSDIITELHQAVIYSALDKFAAKAEIAWFEKIETRTYGRGGYCVDRQKMNYSVFMSLVSFKRMHL